MISYKSGYKYKLALPCYIQTSIRPAQKLSAGHWVSLASDGIMAIDAGYAWDGASGAADTASIMRASLVHDALYQMIREGSPIVRKEADKELYRLCREGGMWWFRAQYVYWAVRLFGKVALRHDAKVRTAP